MDRSDDPRAALVRLRGVHLLPAVLCRRCCGAGGCLIPEDAKHRRPTAGHQSRHHGTVLFLEKGSFSGFTFDLSKSGGLFEWK